MNTTIGQKYKSETMAQGLPEEPSKQTRGKVTRNPSRQRTISQPTRLTEPITPRKRQRIRNRKDERNTYTISQSSPAQSIDQSNHLNKQKAGKKKGKRTN